MSWQHSPAYYTRECWRRSGKSDLLNRSSSRVKSEKKCKCFSLLAVFFSGVVVVSLSLAVSAHCSDLQSTKERAHAWKYRWKSPTRTFDGRFTELRRRWCDDDDEFESLIDGNFSTKRKKNSLQTWLALMTTMMCSNQLYSLTNLFFFIYRTCLGGDRREAQSWPELRHHWPLSIVSHR